VGTDSDTGAEGLLPPDPDLPRLHDRQYAVRAFRLSDEEFLVRGAVRDQLPGGLYDRSDADPLTVHHMVIDLTIAFATFEIRRAAVVFESHPHPDCPRIAPHYENLVGLSIARGFTHKVRELFGGPNGCSHTTALLQAMAPTVVQIGWADYMEHKRDQPVSLTPRPSTSAERRVMLAYNINSCHLWAEDGELVAAVDRGERADPPEPLMRRLRERGVDVDAWLAEHW